MSTFFASAGPLVWPVLLFAVLALGAAIAYARSSEARFRVWAVSGIVATSIVALLATVTGFQRSASALGSVAAEDRWIWLIGLEESLNNVVLALIAAFVVSLVLTVGATKEHSSS